MIPYGVYFKGQLVYLGLHKTPEDVWKTYLGWPSPEEIREKQEAGYSIYELSILRKALVSP